MPAADPPASRTLRSTLAGMRTPTVLALVAVVALVVGHQLERNHPDGTGYRIAAYGCAAALAVAGFVATRLFARNLERIAAGGGAAPGPATTPLRVLVQLVGYLLTALGVLDVLHVDLSQFLVGGAVTGVVLGIAAQQALGNVFAGIILVVTRPYSTGDAITVFSSTINGPHDGTVADIGLIYTQLRTADGMLTIPNGVLLTSAVRHTRKA